MANVIDALSKKPAPFKAAVFFGVAVVFGLGYWQLVYSSLSEEYTGLKAKASKLQKENQTLKDREQKWLQLVQQKEELDDMLKANQVSLPASSELPSFFVHLQKQAAASGVSLQKWQRLAEMPVETYVKVPVAIDVIGTFYQINNYFRLLYETDRIITVEELSFGGAKTANSEVQLTASFKASTFRQRDLPPNTTLPAAPAPKPTDKDKPKSGATSGPNKIIKTQTQKVDTARNVQQDNAKKAAEKAGAGAETAPTNSGGTPKSGGQ